MALQLSCTIKGFLYPISYWRRAAYRFNDIAGCGEFVLVPYASKSARDNSLSNSLDDGRIYQITKEMTKAECYEFAKTYLEGQPPQETIGADDLPYTPPDDRVSFFAGAIDV